MVDNGFVDILSNSLNNSDPQIVTQAIKTVLAIAEDGKCSTKQGRATCLANLLEEITNGLLVDGEFIPKILRILQKDKDGTRTGAIRAIRRLSGNREYIILASNAEKESKINSLNRQGAIAALPPSSGTCYE